MKTTNYLNFLKKERGVSVLIVLMVGGIIILVISQIISLAQPQKKQAQLVQTIKVESNNKQPQSPGNIRVQTENIKKYLVTEAALLGVTDNMSLYFKDMQQPDSEVSIDPTKSWLPASTIKSYVLLEAFRQKRLGLVNFSQEVTVVADNVVSTELETDEFPRLREGVKVKIGQLVEEMIIQSDNTAYNTLLDILDRRNINSSLRNIGITETVVGEKLNLDGNQSQKDLQVAGRQPNTTTVKDLATFFSLLYSHKVADSEDMLSIFKRQKINNMIPARLPEDTVVAHKTGDWAPIYHDGGVVYKPSDPFVFVTFTNSGDPAVVAKLAAVAFYQDVKYVGKNITVAAPLKNKFALASRSVYYTNEVQQVLGEKTDSKFPDVTAEDLGITSKDLIPDSRQVNKVGVALVVPGSTLYDLKKFFESGQLALSFNNNQQARTYLKFANNRLSEIKNVLSKGEVERLDQLLSEAVDDIKNATNLTKVDIQNDILPIEIKKTNDLYYAVMAERAANLADDKKEQFVDSVYNFYQRGKAEISPAINSSVIVSPTQQKPTIGVIERVSLNQMTLKFDDGSTKQVNLSSGTNVRSVSQEMSEDLSALKLGNKVAILGPAGAGNTINAQFILNNIPQGLTDQHQGTVTEVRPSEGVIKVIDQKGEISLVRVDDTTAVKSKDTNVSLEGIKAGSKVVIFGTSNQSSSSPGNALRGNDKNSTGNFNQAVSTPKPTNKPENSPVPKSGTANTQPQSAAPTAPTTVAEIKATSVTIVGNSSGKNEQEKLPTTENKESSSKPNPPQPPGNTGSSTQPPAENKIIQKK